MNYIGFGNRCFNIPASEKVIDLVIASKSEAADIADFVNKAAEYLCTEIESYNGETPESVFSDIILAPTGDDEKTLINNLLSDMNKQVELRFEKALNIVHVTKTCWNKIEFAAETEHNYILFLWSTTA